MVMIIYSVNVGLSTHDATNLAVREAFIRRILKFHRLFVPTSNGLE